VCYDDDPEFTLTPADELQDDVSLRESQLRPNRLGDPESLEHMGDVNAAVPFFQIGRGSCSDQGSRKGVHGTEVG
jgi:hypothetical protein